MSLIMHLPLDDSRSYSIRKENIIVFNDEDQRLMGNDSTDIYIKFPPITNTALTYNIRISHRDLENRVQLILNDSLVSIINGADEAINVQETKTFSLPGTNVRWKTNADNIIRITHDKSSNADWGRLYLVEIESSDLSYRHRYDTSYFFSVTANQKQYVSEYFPPIYDEHDGYMSLNLVSTGIGNSSSLITAKIVVNGTAIHTFSTRDGSTQMNENFTIPKGILSSSNENLIEIVDVNTAGGNDPCTVHSMTLSNTRNAYRDISGNGYHAIVKSGTTITAYPRRIFCNSPSGASIGAKDSLVVPNFPNCFRKDMTLIGSIYLDDVSTLNDKRILEYGDSAAGNNKSLHFMVRNDKFYTGFFGNDIQATSTPLVANRLYTVAFRYRTNPSSYNIATNRWTGTMDLFIDGVSVDIDVDKGSLDISETNVSDLFLYAGNLSGTKFNIMVFDEALSNSKIRELSRQPMVHYKMDQTQLPVHLMSHPYPIIKTNTGSSGKARHGYDNIGMWFEGTSAGTNHSLWFPNSIQGGSSANDTIASLLDAMSVFTYEFEYMFAKTAPGASTALAVDLNHYSHVTGVNNDNARLREVSSTVDMYGNDISWETSKTRMNEWFRRKHVFIMKPQHFSILCASVISYIPESTNERVYIRNVRAYEGYDTDVSYNLTDNITDITEHIGAIDVIDNGNTIIKSETRAQFPITVSGTDASKNIYFVPAVDAHGYYTLDVEITRSSSDTATDASIIMLIVHKNFETVSTSATLHANANNIRSKYTLSLTTLADVKPLYVQLFLSPYTVFTTRDLTIHTARLSFMNLTETVNNKVRKTIIRGLPKSLIAMRSMFQYTTNVSHSATGIIMTPTTDDAPRLITSPLKVKGLEGHIVVKVTIRSSHATNSSILSIGYINRNTLPVHGTTYEYDVESIKTTFTEMTNYEAAPTSRTFVHYIPFDGHNTVYKYIRLSVPYPISSYPAVIIEDIVIDMIPSTLIDNGFYRASPATIITPPRIINPVTNIGFDLNYFNNLSEFKAGMYGMRIDRLPAARNITFAFDVELRTHTEKQCLFHGIMGTMTLLIMQEVNNTISFTSTVGGTSKIVSSGVLFTSTRMRIAASLDDTNINIIANNTITSVPHTFNMTTVLSGSDGYIRSIHLFDSPTRFLFIGRVYDTRFYPFAITSNFIVAQNKAVGMMNATGDISIKGNLSNMVPRDAFDIKQKYPKAKSGVYMIQPDKTREPFMAYLDMEEGWSLLFNFQNTEINNRNTYRDVIKGNITEGSPYDTKGITKAYYEQLIGNHLRIDVKTSGPIIMDRPDDTIYVYDTNEAKYKTLANIFEGIHGTCNLSIDLKDYALKKSLTTIPQSFRYIRNHSNGSTANTWNHWVEIEAWDYNGNNIALGKVVTGSGITSNLSRVTDGSRDSNNHYSSGSGAHWVQVDLGALHRIERINVLQFYGDTRTYLAHKTEISIDGTNWFTLYDTTVNGTFQSIAAGQNLYPKKSDIHLNSIMNNTSSDLYRSLESMTPGGKGLALCDGITGDGLPVHLIGRANHPNADGYPNFGSSGTYSLYWPDTFRLWTRHVPSTIAELKAYYKGHGNGIYPFQPKGCPEILMVYVDVQSEWILLYNHDVIGASQRFFVNEAGAKFTEVNNPTSPIYSILGHLNYFRRSDGLLELKLDYPKLDSSKFNHWTQRTDPYTQTTAVDFTGIRLDWPTRFNGLLKEVGNALFECDSNGTWWYAIGTYNRYSMNNSGGTGTFPGPDAEVWHSRLWVKL